MFAIDLCELIAMNRQLLAIIEFMTVTMAVAVTVAMSMMSMMVTIHLRSGRPSG